MNKILKELKRRNVFKETIAYLVVAWLILQILSVILPIWNAPNWILQIVTITLVIGLPLWILLSWSYEFTSSGIKKTTNASSATSQSLKTNRRLNAIIMIALIAVIGIIWLNPSIVTSKTPTLRQGIAVLPFENMSADESNEWFGDGVTEDILTHLSKIKGLRVISRTSVMQYKGTTKTIPEICKELGVSHIVEGSVRQLNNKVLVTAQLISATDEHLWADNYDDDLDNAFEVQRNVSKEIVKQLHITISPEEVQALNKSLTTNPEALRLFIKGQDTVDTRTVEGVSHSIELYKRALALDPNFADAYAELAFSYYLQIYFGNLEEAKGRRLIEENISRALKINPNTCRAYNVLALVNEEDNSLIDAKLNYEKALEINPNDALTHLHFGQFLNGLGDIKNSLKHQAEASKLKPFSQVITWNYLIALFYNKKTEEAQKIFKEKESLFSNGQKRSITQRLNVFLNKDWKEEIVFEEKELADNPENFDNHTHMAYAYWHFAMDTTNYLKHAEIGYNTSSGSEQAIQVYYDALLHNQKFDEAMSLISELESKHESVDYVDINDIYWFKGHYFLEIGNYNEALKYYNNVTWRNSQELYRKKAVTLAKLGSREAALTIIQDYITNFVYKASVYAVLEEKELMFASLNERDNIFWVKDYISLKEFNPYRNEPEFQAFQEENYIHIKREN